MFKPPLPPWKKTILNIHLFQVVAREDKGWLGRDWNKSPTTIFSTSRSNPTVAPLQQLDSKVVEKEVLVPDIQPQQPRSSPASTKQKTKTESEDTGGPFSFLVIVGIVIGGLLVLLLVTAALYNVVRMGRRGEEEESDMSDSESLHLEDRERKERPGREDISHRTMREERRDFSRHETIE